MNKLPEKVGIVLIYKTGDKFRKSQVLKNYESIFNGWALLNSSNRPCRIYPISTKRQDFTEFGIQLAWNEAMTLSEFKEYLND